MQQSLVFFYKAIFIFKNSKLNPFANRALFCCIPVLVGWFYAVHFHAMYQTMDDWDMRILLEGSAGGRISTPSEFSLYMNILYGKFLKLFYTIYQNGYWYDIFTYLFCSVSVYVITFTLCKNFSSNNWFHKSIILLVISLVCSTSFFSPQFTITAGLLAISGVLSFFILVSDYFVDNRLRNLCRVYCLFSLVFSALIRFEACMIVSFYSGIVLLPYWPYRCWRNILKKSIIIFSALFIILCLVCADGYFANTNPDWREMRQANIARVDITDKTNMWDNIEKPWKDIENKVKKSDSYLFTKGDYRLLLVAFYLVNNRIWDSANLEKVSNDISPDVQSSKTTISGFKLQDYHKIFPIFVILAFILGVLSFNTWKQTIFICTAFFLLVVGLNIEFRALPYRLWYNFSLVTLIGIMLRANFTIVPSKHIIIKIVSLLFIFFPSYTIMAKQAVATKFQYDVFRLFRSEVENLPSKYLYLASFIELDHVAKPFSKNILEKDFVPLSPLNNNNQYKAIMGEYNISDTDPWDDICSKDSKVRILHNQYVYNLPIHALKAAITFHMLEKYDKHVVFIGKYQTQNLITYQCRTLSDKEFVQREDLKNQLKILQSIVSLDFSIYNYSDYIDIFNAESFEK